VSVPSAVHDPAKVIIDMAMTLALGGDCLADLALLRAEPSRYGRVASDPTLSRTITALAADPTAALKAQRGPLERPGQGLVAGRCGRLRTMAPPPRNR
jgi:hypothetical protein